jgi:hypothetical protein
VTSPATSLGALPPLGALLHAQVHVDPEVLGHDTVTFAAGTQTESVKMQPQELFGSGGSRPCRWSRDRTRAATIGPGRRRAAQQAVAGGEQSAS